MSKTDRIAQLEAENERLRYDQATLSDSLKATDTALNQVQEALGEERAKNESLFEDREQLMELEELANREIEILREALSAQMSLSTNFLELGTIHSERTEVYSEVANREDGHVPTRGEVEEARGDSPPVEFADVLEQVRGALVGVPGISDVG